MKRFRGGLVFKAHRIVCHSTLGWRVIKKKKRPALPGVRGGVEASGDVDLGMGAGKVALCSRRVSVERRPAVRSRNGCAAGLSSFVGSRARVLFRRLCCVPGLSSTQLSVALHRSLFSVCLTPTIKECLNFLAPHPRDGVGAKKAPRRFCARRHPGHHFLPTRRSLLSRSLRGQDSTGGLLRPASTTSPPPRRCSCTSSGYESAF